MEVFGIAFGVVDCVYLVFGCEVRALASGCIQWIPGTIRVDMDQYDVIGLDGRIFKADSLQTLRAWVVQGRVVPTTRIIDPLRRVPRFAGDFDELRDLFENQVPPVQSYFSSTNQSPYPSSSYIPPLGSSHTSSSGRSVSVQVNNSIGNPSDRLANVVGGEKTKVVAILLALFLGCFGAHRFYIGQSNSGILMLLITVLSCFFLTPITSIWALIDVYLIATNQLVCRDGSFLN